MFGDDVLPIDKLKLIRFTRAMLKKLFLSTLGTLLIFNETRSGGVYDASEILFELLNALKALTNNFSDFDSFLNTSSIGLLSLMF